MYALENKPEVTHALIGLDQFHKTEYQSRDEATQEKFFRRMEVKLFFKRNKTVSLVFLDSNRKRYDV